MQLLNRTLKKGEEINTRDNHLKVKLNNRDNKLEVIEGIEGLNRIKTSMSTTIKIDTKNHRINIKIKMIVIKTLKKKRKKSQIIAKNSHKTFF